MMAPTARYLANIKGVDATRTHQVVTHSRHVTDGCDVGSKSCGSLEHGASRRTAKKWPWQRTTVN